MISTHASTAMVTAAIVSAKDGLSSLLIICRSAPWAEREKERGFEGFQD